MKTLPRAILIVAAMATYATSANADVPAAAPRAQGDFARMSKVAPAARASSPCAKSSAFGPFAEQQDPTLATYAYDADYTYPIPMRANQQTHIVLGEDESLVSFTLGDRNKKLWPTLPSVTKRDLFIVPAAAGQRAAATIITSKRRYELQLCSGDDGPAYQRVSWQYTDMLADGVGAKPTAFGFEITAAPGVPGRPETAGSKPASPRIDAMNMNTNYRIEGNAEFKPVMVFDDGRMTYYQLPHNAKLSAVFILDKDGQGEMARVIPLGNDMYQIQEVVTYGALLKRGKDEVRIFNGKGSGCGFFSCDTKPVKNIDGGA